MKAYESILRSLSADVIDAIVWEMGRLTSNWASSKIIQDSSFKTIVKAAEIDGANKIKNSFKESIYARKRTDV